jgi:hypothetical protein
MLRRNAPDGVEVRELSDYVAEITGIAAPSGGPGQGV